MLHAGAFTSSLPFRVSYLNTPFRLIRSLIRISTPHCKQFTHSLRYTPQPSISFQDCSVRCIHSFHCPQSSHAFQWYLSPSCDVFTPIKNVKNALTDESIPKEKRALILYIDLMIGKWRPYDGHLIFEY